MDARAARFEDEKRRIVESCFNKREVDGSLQETYITHVRITEYSSHPTSPPPPQARGPDSEKPRVIVVSVRKSGRVRMHKSKENPNGSFSIGKTWNLDDLSTIESFTGPSVNPQNREWGGDTGFTVVVGKPYFWNAQSDKEKKFFVASLVKIYAKYTGGRAPELLGFDQRELDQVMGGSRRPPPSSSSSSPAPPRPPIPINEPSMSSTSNLSLSASSAAGTPNATANQNANAPHPGYGYHRKGSASPGRRPPPPHMQNGANSPVGSVDSSASQGPPGLRKMAGVNKSQESVAASMATRSDDGSSVPPRSRNGMPGPGSFGSRYESPGPGPGPRPSPSPQPPPSHPPQPTRSQEEIPPERKRPPMDPLRPPNASDQDLVPAPLMSPALRRDPVAPPPRSSERSSPRKPSTSQSQRSETNSLHERPLTANSAQDRPITPAAASESPPHPPPPTNDSTSNANAPRNGSFSTVSSVPAVAPAPEAASEPPTAGPPAEPEEEARPGLGPMIKAKKSKGEIAGAFWKAAATANAFKPRPGGAGDRLRQLQNKSPEAGSDGITGVFQPPPRPKSAEQEKRDETPTPEPSKEADGVSELPSVKVTVPSSSRPTSLQKSVKDVKEATKEEGSENNKKKTEETAAEEVTHKSVVSGNDAKYLASLGIDSSILDSRSSEFTKWLDYFGWVPGEKMRSLHMDDLRVDIDRELNRAQAGGWLARFREDDERVEAIKRGIDVSISECEELDNLLTLYSVELSTLSDDIAYIEAQGQGLQVQTANQKTLKKELESLLETTAIKSSDLDALKSAPLENIDGLEEIELALVTLYKAMIKIDPSLGGDQARRSEDVGLETDRSLGLDKSDYGKMRIVKEKKQMYLQESSLFMRRFIEYMARQFIEAQGETSRQLNEALSRKVDSRHHDAGRDMLWSYSPLVLYARDVDRKNWDRLLQLYQGQTQPVYKREFQQIITAYKKYARKMPPDELADLLFTSHAERKEEGIATTARKLTVKRSQTLAKSLRSPLDGGSKTNLKSSESQSLPCETFASVLDDLLPLVEMEQNFIVDFFHATTLDQSDFPDAVAASRPRDRSGGDLKRHRLMEPDRDLARRVTKAMETIFAFLDPELNNLIHWVLASDSLQGVGVLAALEQKSADISQTNQDFLNALLQKLHGGLETQFRKFVDEQIRAIEETKVKINKRKGVISFVRIFPNFSASVENILAGVDPSLEVRATVDREYDRMLKTMFDSLKVIARENPAAGGVGGASSAAGGGLGNVSGGGGFAGASSADPEDKEALNFHILLIENANHFLEEVEARGLEVLEDWRANAAAEMDEHMRLYVGAVVRRPLGRLLEYLENIEAQLASSAAATSVASQPSNSRAVFNKVLGNYDAKEVRKGIETLRKRVEKHFGDADDPALSRNLVAKVLAECERYYASVELRISRVTADVYGGDVLFEWPRHEVKTGFAAAGR